MEVNNTSLNKGIDAIDESCVKHGVLLYIDSKTFQIQLYSWQIPLWDFFIILCAYKVVLQLHATRNIDLFQNKHNKQTRILLPPAVVPPLLSVVVNCWNRRENAAFTRCLCTLAFCTIGDVVSSVLWCMFILKIIIQMIVMFYIQHHTFNIFISYGVQILIVHLGDILCHFIYYYFYFYPSLWRIHN
jgi:hypothetical protein